MNRCTRWAGALALAFHVSAAALEAQDPWTSGRPDGHAPLGVMGDHTHSAGEVMLSYRFMRMEMDGNRSGTESLAPEDVLDDYMVTPLNMPMSMHMVGAMYAPSDRVTLMAMVPFLSREMEHQTRMGGMFTTESSGLGDISLTGLVNLYNQNRDAAILNLGVRFPTGSIEQADQTPASAPNEVQLPYPMQIGSGTVDFLPGLTYLGQSDKWSWGLQAKGTLRLGENDRDYRLGHEGMATGWFANRVSDWLSGSLRLEGRAWGNIEGADPDLNPAMVPTADPMLRAGKRIDAFAGINFEVASGPLHGQRLAVEVGAPLWQDLDGPQLETDWVLVAGWQYAFPLFGEHD
jgi:hypothetical protein